MPDWNKNEEGTKKRRKKKIKKKITSSDSNSDSDSDSKTKEDAFQYDFKPYYHNVQLPQAFIDFMEAQCQDTEEGCDLEEFIKSREFEDGPPWVVVV